MKKFMVFALFFALCGTASAVKKRQDGESGGSAGGGMSGAQGKTAGQAKNASTAARELVPKPKKQEVDPYKKDRSK
jgi:hypothetical protein